MLSFVHKLQSLKQTLTVAWMFHWTKVDAKRCAGGSRLTRIHQSKLMLRVGTVFFKMDAKNCIAASLVKADAKICVGVVLVELM